MTRTCPTEPAKMVATLKGHPGRVAALAFTADRCLLASGSQEGAGRVWDVARGKPGGRGGFDKPGDAYRSIAFAPHGRRMAVGSGALNGLVWLFDVTDDPPREVALLRGARGPVEAVAFSPDGRLVAGGGEDRTVRVWDAAASPNGTPRAVLVGHTGPVTALAFTPDGRGVATASEDSTVRLWALGLIRPTVRAVMQHPAAVTSVAFSPDGGMLATGCRDGSIRVWGVGGLTPDVRAEVTGHAGGVRRVLLAPDGGTVVSVGADGRVVNREVRSGTVLREWQLPRVPGPGVALTADGRYLADAADDGTIEVYRVAEKR